MNQSNSEQKLNTQKMSYLCDQILKVLELITKNKEIYKTNSDEMLRLVKLDNPNFYNLYPRICRTLVFEDDISPLLGMIQTFSKVQEGTMSWNNANDIVQNALNAKYIDPVLNSEPLVKEREEKQKEEAKQKIIDITNK